MSDRDDIGEEREPASRHRLEKMREAMRRSDWKFAQGDKKGADEDLTFAADQWARMYTDTPEEFRGGRALTDLEAEEATTLIESCRSLTLRPYSHLVLNGALVRIAILATAERMDKSHKGQRRLCLRITCFDASQDPDERGPFDHLDISSLPVYLEYRRKPRRRIPNTPFNGKILFHNVQEGTVIQLCVEKKAGRS